MKIPYPSNGLTLFSFLLLSASGCGNAKFVFENSGSSAQLETPTVCAAFDPAGSGTERNGLTSKITYLEDNQTRVTRVEDLLTNGRDAGVQLYLNQVDVPALRFTEGFRNSATGELLKRPTGDALIEWFAFDLQSEFALMAGDAEGFYQFALLSDDGATLELSPTGSFPGMVLIDNDGLHSTQMGCSTKAIQLRQGESRPIHVKYFQGPRVHIAVTLMWRKVAAENSSNDALCGMGGPDYFWDMTTTPSTPTAKYNELVARGWKIPKARNFNLPANARSNPCAGL